MTVIAVSLVSWRLGRNFTAWHIEQKAKPMCGAVIPDKALVNRTPRLLFVTDLCRSCLKAYSVLEDE